MDYLENLASPFSSIPQRKIEDAIEDIKNLHLQKSGALSVEGSILIDAIQRYAKANIPADYWFLDMHDFYGDNILNKIYNDTITDLSKTYKNGSRFCLAGSHGTGKTFVTSCILKRAVESGKFSGLYVNMTDIINVLASPDAERKYEARKSLLDVDFLAIDEFDSRFVGSDNSSDLFGRILEPTIRSRIQNGQPLILCTNNTNVTSLFHGQLQVSVKSLMNSFKIIPVIGGDFRETKK